MTEKILVRFGSDWLGMIWIGAVWCVDKIRRESYREGNHEFTRMDTNQQVDPAEENKSEFLPRILLRWGQKASEDR